MDAGVGLNSREETSPLLLLDIKPRFRGHLQGSLAIIWTELQYRPSSFIRMRKSGKKMDRHEVRMCKQDMHVKF